MYKLFSFVLLINIFSSCLENKSLTERDILQNKLNAFSFLSDNHDKLHIMMGEYDGDKQDAFIQFKSTLNNYENTELIPISKAFNNINDVDRDSISVRRLDVLVDYYQSGLSMQIEAILKAYGYNDVVHNQSILSIYDSLASNN